MLGIRSQAGAYSVSISPETEQEGLFFSFFLGNERFVVDESMVLGSVLDRW